MDRAGTTILRRQVASYDELVRLLRSGTWLPPIPYARLDSERIVRPLVVAERGGHDAYVSLIVTRADSSITMLSQLRGRKMAWVDPLSATGYVVPRVRIAARFPQPKFFAAEAFFGSHAAVVRAVLDRYVDAGATYGGFTDEGTLARGAFEELGPRASDVRVVEAFGAIPPDVVAVRAHVSDDVQAALAAAFEAACSGPRMLDAVRVTFGAMAFARKPLVGYDVLRTEVEQGVDSGVIPAAAAFLSTRPPSGT
jgi:phosphonate transport system substrate-binding protein